MARTKEAARKAPRREEAVAQHIPGLEDDAEDEAEEDEDGDDGLQCWDMHDLLVATLVTTRAEAARQCREEWHSQPRGPPRRQPRELRRLQS